MGLFFLKKVITILIMPINVVLLLLTFAIIFFWKKPRASICCLILATITLFLVSLPPISDQLMGSLENRYPAYIKKKPKIDYIVVLGCGHTSNSTLPVTSQLDDCSLERTVEALRIYKLHPEAKIITSGYAPHDEVTNAEKVKQALVLLGVPELLITTENSPRDTEEEAKLITPKVKGSDVVVVTNAAHMQRAIQYFQMQGVYPIPAPTGYWVKNLNGEKNWGYYIPNGEVLAQTTTVWYEVLGQVVQWLKTVFH